MGVDSVCPDDRSGPFHDVDGGASVDTLKVLVVCLQFVVFGCIEGGFDNLGNQLSQDWVSRLGLERPLLKLDSSAHVVLPVLDVHVFLDSDNEPNVTIRVEPRVDGLLQPRVDVRVESTKQEDKQVPSKVTLDDLVGHQVKRLDHLGNGV